MADRRDLYLHGEATDERLDAAVAEFQPLPETDIGRNEEFEERVRQIVRDEIDTDTQG